MEDEAKKEVAELVRLFLKAVGEDPNREGLRETPLRVAKMWIEELTAGYRLNPEEYLKTFGVEDIEKYGDMVIIKDVPVRSICEHHLLPFFGYAHIAYVPRERILGFSKFARIIDVFSKRLQIQERLTKQVADFLVKSLNPEGLFLMIEALHTCSLVRGIEEPMYMVTRAIRGVFRERGDLRAEALRIFTSKTFIEKYLKEGQTI